MTLFDRFYRLAQDVDFTDQEVIIVPLQQVDGEEICAAGMPGASVVGHDGVMANPSAGLP